MPELEVNLIMFSPEGDHFTGYIPPEYVSALVPTKGDFLEIDQKRYQVMNVEKLYDISEDRHEISIVRFYVRLSKACP